MLLIYCTFLSEIVDYILYSLKLKSQQTNTAEWIHAF